MDCYMKALLDQDNANFAPFLNLTTLHFDVEMATDIITVMQHAEFPSSKEFLLKGGVLPWAETE